MDVCSAQNRIGSYVPATNVTDIALLSKNVDAVTVEANLVACNKLTINGVDVSTNADKTQNISFATYQRTVFDGEIIATDLTANQLAIDTILPNAYGNVDIAKPNYTTPLVRFAPDLNRVGINYIDPQQALDVRASNTQTSASSFAVDAANLRIGVGVTNPSYPVHVVSAATASTNLMALLQPNVPVSAYSQIFFGKDTGKNMGLRYTTSSTDTAATNYGSILISATELMRLYQSQITLSVPMFPLSLSVAANSGTNIVQVTTNTTARKMTLELYRIGLSTNNRLLLRVGSVLGTPRTDTIYNATSIYFFGSTVSWTGNATATGLQLSQNLDNNEKICGKLTLTYMGDTGWFVEGTLKSVDSPTSAERMVQVSCFITLNLPITGLFIAAPDGGNFNVTGSTLKVSY